jgi:hypothetical protein
MSVASALVYPLVSGVPSLIPSRPPPSPPPPPVLHGVTPHTIAAGGKSVAPQAAWTYNVTDETAIEQKVAFYLRAPLVAMVDGVRALPQEGDFYGGWITSDVVGPFKGGPGTRMW